MNFAIGVDAGGTASRAVALAEDGTRLGSGLGGGSNPNSVPAEQAAAAVAAVIADAMRGLDPSLLRACVIGMAGTSKLTDPAVATIFETALRPLGLKGKPRFVSDAEAAFASATEEPDGTVLIAGTGSIAGRIRGRRMASVVGGYGWLLGDEGSGFWIGREAVRRTLDALHGDLPLGKLATAVLAEAGVPPDETRAAHLLITAANADLPVRLSRFAPLVSDAAAADPVARDIVERAAAQLVEAALAAREPGETTPVVLVGSVLGNESPVGELVRADLSDLRVLASSDGVGGAVRLAMIDAFGEHAATRPSRGVTD